MSFQQNIEQLKELRLSAFSERYDHDQGIPDNQALGFDERLNSYLDAQLHHNRQMRFERLMRQSKIKYKSACREHVKYTSARNLDKSTFDPLFLCEWIKRSQNIIVCGLTGTGKTYLACALGVEAIRRDNKVLFIRYPLLVEEMAMARAEGTIAKYRTKLSKFKVLVIDDWGISPIEPLVRQDLLEIIEAVTNNGSLIITSQLPISSWHDSIGESTIADAILDRIVHRSHKFELEGESMRKQGQENKL
ncbi:IS21-like element ISFK1 family helper ATPase IstB [Kangiella japonica]|uniref:IS21-like element ISFK1 family helper ATPase IstB n=1 Tax=Kangiella japonica TaxID=647384 RepID=A0ABN0T3F5_9GAMM